MDKTAKKIQKKALIVSGGNANISVVKNNLECDFIIAVDSGSKSLVGYGIVPDVIIGDLDSLGIQLSEEYQKKGIEIIRAKCEKDETDTELAVIYAIEKGFKEVILLGATGSRLDHTFGNILLLKKLKAAGVEAKITDKHNEIIFVDSESRIEKDGNYKYVSILPFGGKVKGLSLKGFKYDVDSIDLNDDSVIGISNELVSDFGDIKIDSGSVLVIKSKD